MPLIDLPVVRFIWSFIRVSGVVRMIDRRVGVNQREDVMMASGIRLANQARWVLIDCVDEVGLVSNGSKEEKRSVIIRERKFIFFLRFEVSLFV